MNKNRIPYFEFYPTDFMHGVRGLTAQEVGIYTMILCLIYEESGKVEYHIARLSAYCGTREATLAKTLDRLVDLGKLTINEGMISNRRAESEISIRADKLKKKSHAGKVSAEKRQQKQPSQPTPVQQVGNYTDSDTDTDKKEEPNGSLSSGTTLTQPHHVDDVAEAVAAYNATASSAGWPEVRVLSKARRSSLKARLREAGGIEGWHIALGKARESPLCNGQNDRGWVASFDFLTRQSSFTKLMEGTYDNRNGSSNTNGNTGRSGPHHDMVAAFAQVAAQRSGGA